VNTFIIKMEKEKAIRNVSPGRLDIDKLLVTKKSSSFSKDGFCCREALLSDSVPPVTHKQFNALALLL
jgi:hypothetical protein